MMISGHVQDGVKNHNGQKTDLNDAFAIPNLAYDRWLTPIREQTAFLTRLPRMGVSQRS